MNRAEYGKEVLKQLSAALTKEFGKGYSQDNLKLFRRFYVIYSQDQIGETVFTESKNLPVTLEWRRFYLSWGHYIRLMRISRGLEEYIKKSDDYKEKLAGIKFKQGDVTTTMIECENGETILLKLDTTLPHLYDRNLTVEGTEGFYCQTTKSVVLDDKKYDHDFDPIEKSFLNQKDYDEYLPEDWKDITQEQIDAGHGGMDYVMLKHFFRYIKNEEEMPIDVYDAVSWMSITALSEESIAKGSIPIECPDFTRGKYKNRKL